MRTTNVSVRVAGPGGSCNCATVVLRRTSSTLVRCRSCRAAAPASTNATFKCAVTDSIEVAITNTVGWNDVADEYIGDVISAVFVPTTV